MGEIALFEEKAVLDGYDRPALVVLTRPGAPA
jgi:hypothetical protein